MRRNGVPYVASVAADFTCVRIQEPLWSFGNLAREAGGQAFLMLGVMSDEIPDGISSGGVSLYGSLCEGVF
jgi:hypothetical protein